jgi:hypothetical protein
MIGPPDSKGNVLIAWDPVAQKERWRAQGGGSTGGGTVTTAGNLVIQVLADGRVVFHSADKGEKLHEIQTSQRVGMGPPMTYMVNGRQYISLMGGRGAGPGPAAAPVPAPGAAPAAAAPVPAAGAAQPTSASGQSTPPPAGAPRVMTYALDAK